MHLYSWSTAGTLSEAGVLEANKGAVSAVAFAPDGALLAAGDASVLPSRDPALLLTRGVACRAPARSSFMTLKHVVYALAPCHSPGAQFDRLPPTGSLPSRGGRTTARACTVSRGRPTGRTSRPGPWTPTYTCGVSRRCAASVYSCGTLTGTRTLVLCFSRAQPLKTIAIKNAGPGGVWGVRWLPGAPDGEGSLVSAGADASVRVWRVVFHAG